MSKQHRTLATAPRTAFASRGVMRTAATVAVSGALVLGTGAAAPSVASAPVVTAAQTAGRVAVTSLETEAATHPLGVDARRPRLSWQLSSAARGIRQDAFQIKVATSAAKLRAGNADVWSTTVKGARDPWVDYTGPRLQSLQRFYWTVRVRTAAVGRQASTTSSWSGWSTPTWFETGFVARSWQAAWIAAPEHATAPPEACSPVSEAIRTAACTPPSPRLRTEFRVKKPIAKARLYASGLGYGVYYLNGKRTSDAVLDPGFTDYTKRAFYVVHDVTRAVHRGTNALGVELGRGIYGQQSYNFAGYQAAPWHSEPELRLELHLTYADGTTQVVGSDPSWKVTDGPSRFNDIMRGEDYDARRDAELSGWSSPGFDDSAWEPARASDGPGGMVVAQNVEPVRPAARLPFQSVKQTGPDRYLFDLGQNVAGSVILDGDLPTGVPVQIRYGEKLDDTGSIDTDMIPGPYGDYFGQLQKDVYTGRDGHDRWRPEFSYKGFQYVEVTGLLDVPDVSLFTAEVWHNDVKNIGTWHSSSRLADSIVGNTRRAVLNNLFWQPTDTPIYEKSGYTGDGQLMAATNNYMFDMQRFYTKWAVDIADAQNPANGELLGIVAPTATRPGADDGWPGPSPGWDVALFNVPDAVRTYTGDERPLIRSTPAMKAYRRWIESHVSDDGVLRGQCQTLYGPNPCTNGLGDWVTVPGQPYGVSVDSTAWYHEMLRVLGSAARLTGDQATVESTRRARRSTAAAFDRTFWDPAISGYRNDPEEKEFSQHQQAIALGLGLVPRDRVRTVGNSLASDIRSRDHHLSTGIMGTRFLWDALTRTGHLDDAFKVATQTTYPSYGYWIDKLGWSALGENWEADTRSRSHMMFGTVVQWFYEDLAGYRPTGAGWSRIEFRPEIPTTGLNHVSASTHTVRGKVATSWRKTDTGLLLQVTVPAGATGRVHVPARFGKTVTEGGTGTWLTARKAPGVRLVGTRGDRIVYQVGSGTYQFRISR